MFPEDIKNLKGTIKFQRPANEKLDFAIPFELNDKYSVLVPLDSTVPGSYNVKIKWKANGINYLFKDKYFN